MSDGLIIIDREYHRAAVVDGASPRSLWDITSSTDNPTPTTVAGTNQRFAVLRCPDGQLTYARLSVRLPDDLYVPAGISARLIWKTAASTGSARHTIDTAFVDDGDDLDPTYNAGAEEITPAAAVADERITTDFVALDMTGAVAGALMMLRIGRDATDSDDDLVDDVDWIGLELQYQRRLVLP